jgi:hypothetical protein
VTARTGLCVAAARRGLKLTLNGQKPVFWCTLTKPLARLFRRGPCVPACSALRLKLEWRYGTAPPVPRLCEYMMDRTKVKELSELYQCCLLPVF